MAQPMFIIDLPDEVINLFLSNNNPNSFIKFNKDSSELQLNINNSSYDCFLAPAAPSNIYANQNGTLSSVSNTIHKITSDFVPVERFSPIYRKPVTATELQHEPEPIQKSPLPRDPTPVRQSPLPIELIPPPPAPEEGEETEEEPVKPHEEPKIPEFKSLTPRRSSMKTANIAVTSTTTTSVPSVVPATTTPVKKTTARRNSKGGQRKLPVEALSLRENIIKLLAPQSLSVTQLRLKLKGVDDEELFEVLGQVTTNQEGTYTLLPSFYTEVSLSWPFNVTEKRKTAANMRAAFLEMGKKETDPEILELVPILQPVRRNRKSVDEKNLVPATLVAEPKNGAVTSQSQSGKETGDVRNSKEDSYKDKSESAAPNKMRTDVLYATFYKIQKEQLDLHTKLINFGQLIKTIETTPSATPSTTESTSNQIGMETIRKALNSLDHEDGEAKENGASNIEEEFDESMLLAKVSEKMEEYIKVRGRTEELQREIWRRYNELV